MIIQKFDQHSLGLVVPQEDATEHNANSQKSWQDNDGNIVAGHNILHLSVNISIVIIIMNLLSLIMVPVSRVHNAVVINELDIVVNVGRGVGAAVLLGDLDVGAGAELFLRPAADRFSSVGAGSWK